MQLLYLQIFIICSNVPRYFPFINVDLLIKLRDLFIFGYSSVRNVMIV